MFSLTYDVLWLYAIKNNVIKQAKTLEIWRENEKILTVSRKKKINCKNILVTKVKVPTLPFKTFPRFVLL